MLKYLWPALIPSWQFFKSVEASPRVSVAFADAAAWSDVRPPPPRMGWRSRLLSLVWNPKRNEALFLVSLAERLDADPARPVVRLMERRLARSIDHSGGEPLQFKLTFVDQTGSEVRYVSCPWTPQ